MTMPQIVCHKLFLNPRTKQLLCYIKKMLNKISPQVTAICILIHFNKQNYYAIMVGVLIEWQNIYIHVLQISLCTRLVLCAPIAVLFHISLLSILNIFFSFFHFIVFTCFFYFNFPNGLTTIPYHDRSTFFFFLRIAFENVLSCQPATKTIHLFVATHTQTSFSE